MSANDPKQTSPRQARATSLFVGDDNLFLRRIDDEYGQQPSRLRRAGVGAHLMVVAGHLRPAFSCLVDMLGLVVDLATNLTFQHGCIDEGPRRGGDVRATRHLDRIQRVLHACSYPARWATRGQRLSTLSSLGHSSPALPHLSIAVRCPQAAAKRSSSR